jgi:hypothetical protein
MFGSLVLSFALLAFQSPSTAPTPQQSAPVRAVEPALEVDKGKALSKVRRIYVESFGTTEAAQQLQAMVISSLTESKRLTVTEDKTKADAILKGFASEKSSQEVHAYGSGTSVATAAGGHSGSISGSSINGSGHISGSHSGGFGAAASSIEDSSVNTETIDSAKASVRLINADGDVIWTSTQESRGAKYKGASADVADKMIKQLVRDMEKAEKETTTSISTKQ